MTMRLPLLPLTIEWDSIAIYKVNHLWFTRSLEARLSR
jgi:hypothetical protein